MKVSDSFIRRPVATILLTLALVLAGTVAFTKLPAASSPEVDLPAISISAEMSGASPETMASTVATPLERRLGAIASVTHMTSRSSTGSTQIDLGFEFDRDINGAARDVQAAINAARVDLPSSLSANPSYTKMNSADAPITYLSITSHTLSLPLIFDAASRILLPQLTSIQGVGKVDIFGSSPEAVRVELNPNALSKYGIGLEDIRATLAAANANSPKGAIEAGERRFQIYVNDKASRAKDYNDLVVAYRNGFAVKLSDVAEVIDSVEEPRAAAFTNRTPSILLRIYRTPHANIIETVDRIKDRLTDLRRLLPAGIDIAPVSDRTATIRASLNDLELTLAIVGALVVLTVFVFLQSARATIIPAVVVPVSILGTFCIMAVLRFSLDALSLMALIIGTGLVIDDSVIVLENISRHIETGIPPLQASLHGVEEVGFTVLATSASLVTIFVPFFFIEDVTGRMLREFAVTLSAAIVISFAISVTTAPMLCALLLVPKPSKRQRWIARCFEAPTRALQHAYGISLSSVLAHPKLTLAILCMIAGFNIVLYEVVPKGLLPEQDPGWLIGGVDIDSNASVDELKETAKRAVNLILADPDVQDVNGQIYGASTTNTAELHILLKTQDRRKASAEAIASRLEAAIRQIPGASAELDPPQDVNFSVSTGTGGLYQYELQGDDIEELRTWTHRLTEALKTRPEIENPWNDQGAPGFETRLVIDRATASRLGISASQIDNTLADAFSQRQASTIFDSFATRRVVMEVAPKYRQYLNALEELYISTSAGVIGGVQSTNAPIGSVSEATTTADSASLVSAISSSAARNQSLNAIANSGQGQVSTGAAVSTTPEIMIPLAAMIHFEHGPSPLVVIHNNGAVASHIRFRLAPSVALSQAMSAIEQTAKHLYMPASINHGFSGATQALQQSSFKELALISVVLAILYIVLGILYESFIHPLTILSTFFSVGVGAFLALIACHMAFTIIAFIGIILLIGIVMKNAIMMIDVALRLERNVGLQPQDAIHQACLLRFRPIMMTSFAALFGAFPLAFSTGEGAELRQPLGITIAGGLILSQILTLYTTPVVYLTIDRLCLKWKKALNSASERTLLRRFTGK